jgi:soluble lytic murein transglycosylase-like protein
MGLCIAIAAAGLTSDYYGRVIKEQTAAFETQVNSLQSTIGFLDEDIDEAGRLMGLAVEFNTTPTIVAIVDHYSQEVVRNSNYMSLIRTHENFTHLMLSLMWHESRVTATATGDKGRARGLSQIWTTTAQDYDPDVTAKELLKPETNIKISILHYVALLEHFEGNDKLALLAWNRGRTRVDDLISMGHDPDNGFAEKVRVASVNASRSAVVASFMKGD